MADSITCSLVRAVKWNWGIARLCRQPVAEEVTEVYSDDGGVEQSRLDFPARGVSGQALEIREFEGKIVMTREVKVDLSVAVGEEEAVSFGAMYNIYYVISPAGEISQSFELCFERGVKDVYLCNLSRELVVNKDEATYYALEMLDKTNNYQAVDLIQRTLLAINSSRVTDREDAEISTEDQELDKLVEKFYDIFGWNEIIIHSSENILIFPQNNEQPVNKLHPAIEA